MRQFLIVIPTLAAVFLVGCGSRPGPVAQVEEVVPVSGTLTFQGKPLDRYQVSFIPSDGRRPAVGITDAQGHFQLGTNSEGDGAPAGTHAVTVAWAGPPPSDALATGEYVEAVPKQPVDLPAIYANPETSGLTQEVPPEGLTDLKIDLK